jgi:DNA mismatch repair protein MutL
MVFYMTSKIRILSEQTINKIAAGEVIENPASVVKELIENALDAGSKDIYIEIKGGGRQLIRVSDNGSGMERDDALLCLERHATSKIREVEDLQTLFTMGFRGEAVPSIAAISKFSLLTAALKEDKQGSLILVEGGEILSCSSAIRGPGTTVEVKDLFFNVPVRKKFQKSPAYDTQEILKMVGHFALGYPTVQFELISDQRSLLKTPSLPADGSFQQQLENRIERVLGRDFSSELCPLLFHKEPFQLDGFIGLPSIHRPNRTGQYTFINQRIVQSPFISFAVREGYGTALSANRYPVFVLHLRLPGSFIDVNVHPQKKDVRLRHEALLKEHLIQAVQKSLQKKEFSPSATCHSIEPTYPSIYPFPPLAAESVSFELSAQEKSFSPLSPSTPWMLQQPYKTQSSSAPNLFTMSSVSSPPFYRILAIIKGFILLDPSSVNPSLFPGMKSNEGILIIHQKAAHSRIYYERLSKQATQQDSFTYTQPLLLPLTLEFSSAETLLIKEHLSIFQHMGFGIQEFGERTFMVDTVPKLLEKEDVHSFLQSAVQEVNDCQDHRRLQREKEKQTASLASRLAISIKQKISLEEAQSLLAQLFLCEKPLQCSKGKPTFLYLSTEDLSKFFS